MMIGGVRMGGDAAGPAEAWPLFVQVSALAGLLIALFALRAAARLKGHFHDRHYRPIESGRADQSERIGSRPLSWWAVRRVMEYSGRVNVWLAGGFCAGATRVILWVIALGIECVGPYAGFYVPGLGRSGTADWRAGALFQED